MNQIKRLYRSRFNRIVGGVCYGMAKYLNVDPSMVRIGWVLLAILGGTGVLAYLICWIIIPEAPFGT
ncbi:MAG: PspC domain-containing protein [Bacteroidetes bacterium HGW-Bacteroidetes-1]|nr:MAG: PspC domain-containing protein [Bacteroidetes bacterium HGW-Bacteroidetes-1]